MKPTLQIFTLRVGALSTNCYLFVNSQTHHSLIIDPGDDADFIIRRISDLNCQPIGIIATHGHFDHILGVTELKLAYSIPFLLHKDDTFLVNNMRESARYFLGTTVDPPPRVDTYLLSGKSFPFGTININILGTPGHTPGSVCLSVENEQRLFCGDLLFSGGGIGRTDFSYSSAEDMRKSLTRILALPDETSIYPGHGESFQLKQERGRVLSHLASY
ncbi:MBL fold metallo-hydrolase [Candidatus Gottesmanbacteria bacterium]|nr:MBL fold metallo-hydrolase [Candidatus Gottesmanbacteria bacterium]